MNANVTNKQYLLPPLKEVNSTVSDSWGRGQA